MARFTQQSAIAEVIRKLTFIKDEVGGWIISSSGEDRPFLQVNTGLKVECLAVAHSYIVRHLEEVLVDRYCKNPTDVIHYVKRFLGEDVEKENFDAFKQDWML